MSDNQVTITLSAEDAAWQWLFASLEVSAGIGGSSDEGIWADDFAAQIERARAEAGE